MLLALGGNASPSTDDVKAFLQKAGVEVDEDKLLKLGKAFEGKEIDALLEAGKAKMLEVAGSAGGGGGGGGGDAAAPEAEEEEAEAAEEVDVGGGGLFGGDDAY